MGKNSFFVTLIYWRLQDTNSFDDILVVHIKAPSLTYYLVLRGGFYDAWLFAVSMSDIEGKHVDITWMNIGDSRGFT